MMKFLKIALPLSSWILLSLVWFACGKDHFTSFDQEGKVVEVAFAGRILDENNQPIEGAQVRAGGEAALTDDNGVFRLAPVNLPASNAILTINKVGYFDFSRAYVVKDKALQIVTIQLLKKVQIGAFVASAGGTVQVPGGAKIVFPSGAVNYSGQVRVFARYLNPTDATLPLFMPGDLRGIHTGGEQQTLSTFGMLAVELVGAANELLQLNAGQEAEITLPVQSSQSSVAPNEIALWHFDTDQARWIEEGVAQKSGNQYIGKVKHFSFWNCDIGWPLVQLDGQVLLAPNQTPLAGALVRLTILSKGYQGYASTDANGQFGGKVFINEVMQLDVLMPTACGNTVLYTQTVGPFNANTILPAISVNSPQISATEITGRLVDCNNQPIANGYVIVENTGNSLSGFSDPLGVFKVAFVNCATGSSTGNLTGYDLTSLNESAAQPFTLPASTVSLGDINVCQTLSEFIQYTVDGESFTVLKPNGFLEIDRTYINGTDSLQNKGAITFTFKNSGQTGSFPLDFISVQKHWQDSIYNVNINTTVTQYGPAGQQIIGTFGGTYKTNGTSNHNISGSYRVKRQF